ncbi:MAG: hypothetical protein SNJ59_11490 [Aggregatilineales bacterium]
MADEKKPQTLTAALRALANRWTFNAREYSREAKVIDQANPNAHYKRGLADGYYQAALEMAEVVRHFQNQQQSQQQTATETGKKRAVAPPAAPAPSHDTTQAAPAIKPATNNLPASRSATDTLAEPASANREPYMAIKVAEAVSILEYIGIYPRELEQRKDNSFYTVFSKWEPIMPHERLEKLKSADPRIVILDSGKTKDGGDPWVTFAFKNNGLLL